MYTVHVNISRLLTVAIHVKLSDIVSQYHMYMYILPFSHSMKASHTTKSYLDIIRSHVLFSLIQVKSGFPIIKTLIPFLLNFLQ